MSRPILLPPAPSCARRPLVVAALAVLLASGAAHAQLTFGGEPASAHWPLQGVVPTVTMQPVNVTALLAEDSTRSKHEPFRFGATLPVALGLDNAGTWETLPSGDRVWRLRITSPGAYSLSLLFGSWQLPGGSSLFVYNDDRSTLLGAYDERNNKENGEFAIEPLAGDAITLEYFEPKQATAGGRLAVSAVVHDYFDVVSLFKSGGAFSAAGSCEVDVNCPAGADWQDEKRAVTLLIIGGGLCTGALLNDANNDGVQYFMGAFHCGSLNNAIFRFGYEKSGCGSGSAPTNKTVQGSTQLAGDVNKDYRLVRITENIPASYAPYFLGWDKSGVAPANTITIHHPQADVKKISFDNNAPSKSGNQWKVAQWDLGVTEPGSSGCPLLTPQGRFLGQLYGGESYCGFPYNDYYGRIDQAWAVVKTWLDPANTGVSAIDGYDPYGGPALPPVLTGAAPASVQAFQGGTITLTGSKFNGATQVNSGGTLLSPPSGFTVINDGTITYTAPQAAALGAVNVTVTTPGGTSGAQSFTYVETNPPKLVAGVLASGNQPFTWTWGGGANDTAFLLYSLSPSTFTFNGFALLSSFNVLFTQVTNATGIGTVTVIIPSGLVGLFFYTQIATLDGITADFAGASAVSFTVIGS